MRKHAVAPLFAAAIALAACAAASAQTSGASDWAPGQMSAARLIAAGGLDGSVYRAGVEIILKGQAHTYWRNPGDAGVAPVFNFDRSVNLASARALFPAPTRIVEDGADVFGYVGGALLPIEATPRDPAKPVELALDLQYAACERICVPAEAHVAIVLAPGDAPTAFAPRLREAAAALPAPLLTSGLKLRVAPRPGADKPAWIATFEPPPGADSDLFAEAPEGWFFSTARRVDGGFDLVAEERPTGADTTVDVALTLADGARASEARIRLDLAGAPR